nr:siderophore-interacting protein [Curtobacterium sp. Csp1]
MAKIPRLMPENPRLFRARVLRSARVTPSMHRVTVTGDDLHEFPFAGYDHWFRLFLPLPHQQHLTLPEIDGNRWYPQYLAIPQDTRPHLANYTVAGFRRLPDGTAELDVDFVVHADADGALEGRAAIWACAARPGDELAMLDQGRIFDCPDDVSQVLVAAEETGLPAVVGIAASLPRDTVGRIVQEVPTPGSSVSTSTRTGSPDVPRSPSSSGMCRATTGCTPSSWGSPGSQPRGAGTCTARGSRSPGSRSPGSGSTTPGRPSPREPGRPRLPRPGSVRA